VGKKRFRGIKIRRSKNMAEMPWFSYQHEMSRLKEK
jgi:hypothetical protein